MAVPKSLIELALEKDWYIDGQEGVQVYQFDRQSKNGPYRMLHMVMTVCRQVPEFREEFLDKALQQQRKMQNEQLFGIV